MLRATEVKTANCIWMLDPEWSLMLDINHNNNHQQLMYELVHINSYRTIRTTATKTAESNQFVPDLCLELWFCFRLAV